MKKKYASLQEYESFVEQMLENRCYLDPFLSFAELCRSLNTDPEAIDNTLVSETGVHGQDLMERFRLGDLKMILHLRN